jgi:hypothetical protein
MKYRIAILSLLVVCCSGVPASCLEYLRVERPGRPAQELAGKALIEARDGGILLKTADGAIHRLPGDVIRSRKTDDEPLVMLSGEQLAEQLLTELPADFRVHASKNYIVCYNTSRTYAQWTSSLLERLQRAFVSYWKKEGCDVAAPQQPLPVLEFADQASYAAYSKKDLGAAVGNVIGYYNLESNRIMMYDLTGMQAFHGGARGSLHDITALLSQPEAEPLVATIVHEATHQISFNCGLQTRLVANPLWLSEGLATFFETPDLSSSRSWSGIGNVNYSRLDLFRQNLDSGRMLPLTRLVSDDRVFQSPETAVDAYAQAWAWNYFLIRSKPKEYAGYLKTLAAKPLLIEDPPQKRIAEFRKHFGEDLDALEAEFHRRLDRVK